jgi:hypothetical protein
MASPSAKVKDGVSAPVVATEASSSPSSETARGGRVWRVAAAIASGLFHATKPEGGEAPPGVPPPSAPSSSSSSPASSSAAAAAFFAADAADYPVFVDEVREKGKERERERERASFFFFPVEKRRGSSSFFSTSPPPTRNTRTKLKLVDLICNFTPVDDRPDLLRLLRLLDTRAGTLLLAGRGGRGEGGGISSLSSSSSSSRNKEEKRRHPFLPRRFPDFSPEERETVLLRWIKTKGPLGQAVRGLKSLVFLALFRFVEQQQQQGEAPPPATTATSLPRRNPFWEACSYSSPSSSLLAHGGAAKSGGGSSSSSGSSSSPRREGSGNGIPLAVSPAKVATEATLLSRTADASKLRSAAEASARFSELGFSAPVTAVAAAPATGKKEKEAETAVVTLTADAVVVGSGAGGGVAAALLSASGLRVVVLEKGRYFAVNAALPSSAPSSSESSSSNNNDNNNFEPLDLSERAFSQTYERGTLCSSRDLSATALAGSTLGGGTRINWCASFPTPDHVREEWSEVGGLPVAPATSAGGEKKEEGGEGGSQTTTTRFDRALAAVCQRMHVSVNVGVGGGCGGAATNCSNSSSSSSFSSSSSSSCGQPHNGPNSRLAEGLIALGQHAGRVPRNCLAATANANSAADCGSCCFSGCPSGFKQDITHTFLADAARAGALILTGAMTDRVLLEKNKSKEQRKEKPEEEEKKKKTPRRRFVAAGVEATPLPAGSPHPFGRKGGASSSSSSSSSAAAAARSSASSSPSSSCKKPPFRLVVRAPVVIAAAGSLHTPALLLRSGLKNRNIGRGLRLHPSLVVLGRFPKKEKTSGDIEDCGSVRMDRGPIMSAFGKGSADWEGIKKGRKRGRENGFGGKKEKTTRFARRNSKTSQKSKKKMSQVPATAPSS